MISPAGLLEDADGAIAELGILWLDIDHEVAVDVAEARHDGGRDHVEHHFVGRAGLHAGRSGQDFRADFDDNSVARSALERRIGIASECNRMGAATSGFRQGGYGEGSASAGRYSEDNVFLCGPEAGNSFAAGSGVIFANFGGGDESLWAPCDQEVDAMEIKGGRNFDGIEGGDASAGPGADVDEAPSAAEDGDEEIDGAGNLRKRAGDRTGDGCVFGVDETSDFERGFLIEIASRRVGLLGTELVEGSAYWFQVLSLQGKDQLF